MLAVNRSAGRQAKVYEVLHQLFCVLSASVRLAEIKPAAVKLHLDESPTLPWFTGSIMMKDAHWLA